MPLKKHLQKIIVACAVALSGAAYSLSQNSPHAPIQSTQVSSTPAQGTTSPQYKVELCTDGDTCRMFPDEGGKKIRVRLVGIDAPETSHGKKQTGQPYAIESKDFLNRQIQGQKVTIKEYGNDMYGRTLGEIYVGERNINREMVENGFAEVYRGKPPAGLDINVYKQAQVDAQKNNRGVWAQTDYQSPKEFRKQKKH